MHLRIAQKMLTVHSRDDDTNPVRLCKVQRLFTAFEDLEAGGTVIWPCPQTVHQMAKKRISMIR
jgi:hypothetical protein